MKTFKHNTKKSLSLLLICLLTAALLLTGCGGSGDDANTGGADGENLKIGIMQFGEFTALQNATKGSLTVSLTRAMSMAKTLPSISFLPLLRLPIARASRIRSSMKNPI